MPHLSLTCAFAIALVACATPPLRPPPFPPAPLLRAPEAPLGEDAPFEARLQRELDGEVLVFPLELVDPAPGDPERALALAQLLVHALDAIPELMPLGLALDDLGQPLPPADFAQTATRYFVGGRLRRLPAASAEPFELALWLIDRHSGRVVSHVVRPDLPRLLAPRNALADLLAEVERGPGEHQRADMGWYEDLDLAQLALAGELVRARHRVGRSFVPADIDALVSRADAEAPWSFLVSAAIAEHRLAGESGCSAATVERLSRVLTLNRVLPFTLEPYALGCALSRGLDPATPALPAWSKQSGSHCRIGAKGLTSVASSRGPLSGQEGQPDASFVTGLGGLYRGESCDAGYAVMHHAPEELGPPFVRAALELEAAFHFYGKRDRSKSTRWFRRAEATAAGVADAHCLVALLGAEATLGLADLAVEDGREDDAREAMPRARAIAERCGDHRMLGRILNSEGLLEQGQSRFDRALTLLGEARAAFTRVADTVNLAVIETNLGVTWLHLGRLDKAIPHLLTALAGKRKVRSEGGIGVLLENLGVAELARGDKRAAARYFEDALGYAIDHHTLATLHVQLARISLALGDVKGAGDHMDKARASSLRTHSRLLEAVIEQTDAAVRVESGDFLAAQRDFHDVLAIRRAIGDRAGEGVTLSLLMALAARMQQPAVAILYGKLAIAAHQEVRVSAGAVDAETAKEFLATRADTYRQLADLLVAEGRLIEAERVLALLKEDEARRWTRDAGAPRAGGVPLTVAERALDTRYDEVAGEVMRLGKEHGALAAKWPRSDAEEARLDTLRTAIEAANQRFLDFLAAIAKEGEVLQKKTQIEDLKEGAGIGADLSDLGPGYVAVYTLVTAHGVHLIVVSPDAQVARTVERREADLNGLIAAFRQALQDPTRDPRGAGQALYQILLAPIEKDLEAAGAKTILWSLDRSLRYLPMGALHDGKRYALERWAMAIFTPASKARMKDTPQSTWRVLALGVTVEHPPFPALPAVAEELLGLVDAPETRVSEGVLEGLKALDGDFTKALLFTQLTRKWPVVHLASHFSFQPGDKDESYLLLGDGSRLTVGELERLPNLFQGVDLLTLSACNTATGDVGGDGTEVESFAVLAQRKGARAVFASLWPVADQSTSALMRRFYTLHASAPNKLEALRRAQLELVEAKTTPPPGTTRAKPLTLPGGPALVTPSSDPLPPSLQGWRHPYYWAPFVLIGNVL